MFNIGIEADYNTADLLFKLTEQVNILKLHSMHSHMMTWEKEADNILLKIKDLLSSKWEMSPLQKVCSSLWLVTLSG